MALTDRIVETESTEDLWNPRHSPRSKSWAMPTLRGLDKSIQRMFSYVPVILLFCLMTTSDGLAQGKLYSARGYWEETMKGNYRSIKEKVAKGDSLTEDERIYFEDYEAFLKTYYLRLREADIQEYERQKDIWDRELEVTTPISKNKEFVSDNKEFEWKGRDRLVQGLYGLYYGISFAAIAELEGTAAVGIPLITTGLWMLGPGMNPKKYEGITRNTLRAGNTGKIVGLVNGGALGMALGGDSEDGSKLVLGLSVIGSIVLGEVAFQTQKQKNFSAGHIELMRHYSFLGPWVGYSALVATESDKTTTYGLGLLAGGITGLIIGNQVSKKYPYTRGDVDAVSSLSLISTGVGFTIVSESIINGGGSDALILVPAVSSIVATVWGQRAVRGAHLTDIQGSTISLSTGGAALLGLGVVVLADPSSPTLWFGIPSFAALITHQVLLQKYKRENLQTTLRGSRYRKSPFKLALQITPESYLMNKQFSSRADSYSTYLQMQNPIVKFKLTF